MKFPNFTPKETELSELFHKFFTPSYVDSQGRLSGFIRRKGQLTGLSFLSMCVFQSHESRQCSLEQGCEYLYDQFQIDIEKQSLDERFSESAVVFMRQMLSTLIKESMGGYPSLADLDLFRSIRITDSSGFELPPSCQQVYTGSGGSASSAQVKLYLDYDLLSGKIEGLSAHPGLHSDARYCHIKAPVQPGDLLLDDLGFYHLDYLKSVAEQDAYFLYRYKTQTRVSQKDPQGNYQQVDLLKLVSKVTCLTSLEVAVGHTQLETRLIIQPIPEKAYQQRIRRLRKEARKKGKTVSKERKTLARYNLFITNAPQSHLPDRSVRLLYSLRWQIELIFKIFKSLFHIDKIQRMHQQRFECILYGKLIAILLAWNIFFLARSYAGKTTELSEWKGFQLIKQKFDQIKKAIQKGPKVIATTIAHIIVRLGKRARKEKKNIPKSPKNNKKPTPFDILYQMQQNFNKNKIHNSLSDSCFDHLA